MHTHLSDLQLDEIRCNEADSAIALHLSHCELCQQRLQQLQHLAQRMGTPVPALEVPVALDQAILQLAQKHAARVRALSRRQQPRRLYARTLQWVAPLAAAAAVALFVTLKTPSTQPETTRLAGIHADAADVNNDGVVNIVDAMLLARALEQGSTLNNAWDVDGNAHVDKHDVEVIARRAVAIAGQRP